MVSFKNVLSSFRRRPGSGSCTRSLCHAGGFTLIELMVVLVIIMAVFGLSSVFFASSLPSARLGSTGRELSATLRYARLLAREEGRSKKVAIDLDRGRYMIEGIQTKNIPEGVSVRITDPVSGEITRGGYSFTFHEYGMAEGGDITLSTKKRSLRIELDPVLGAVVIKRNEP